MAKRASGAERAGNIDHTAITVNRWKARRTRQAVDTGPALKFGGSKGRAQRTGAEAGESSGKEGERWGGAGRQHRPYSYHRQSFESATYKTGGGLWTRALTNFASIPNCTFT